MYSAIKPVLWLSRIIGLSPFTFHSTISDLKFPQQSRYVINKFWFAYAIFLHTMVIYVYYNMNQIAIMEVLSKYNKSQEWDNIVNE